MHVAAKGTYSTAGEFSELDGARNCVAPEKATCRDLIIWKIIAACRGLPGALRASSSQSLQKMLHFLFARVHEALREMRIAFVREKKKYRRRKRTKFRVHGTSEFYGCNKSRRISSLLNVQARKNCLYTLCRRRISHGNAALLTAKSVNNHDNKCIARKYKQRRENRPCKPLISSSQSEKFGSDAMKQLSRQNFAPAHQQTSDK